jgi:hypothetical protein
MIVKEFIIELFHPNEEITRLVKWNKYYFLKKKNKKNATTDIVFVGGGSIRLVNGRQRRSERLYAVVLLHASFHLRQQLSEKNVPLICPNFSVSTFSLQSTKRTTCLCVSISWNFVLRASGVLP